MISKYAGLSADLFIDRFPEVTVYCPECDNAANPSRDDTHWVCPVCDESFRLLPEIPE